MFRDASIEMNQAKEVRIIHFVHTDSLGTFRVGSFHIAREFIKCGIDYFQVLPWRSFWKRNNEIIPEWSVRASALIPSKAYKVRLFWKFALWINSIGYMLILLNNMRIRRWWPDVVMVDSIYFFGIAKIFEALGVKTIIRFTDFIWELDKTINKKEAFSWTIKMLRRSNSIVATNSELASCLQQDLGRNVFCIPNGVDWEHFSKVPEKNESDHKSKIELVYFGSLDSRIDYDLLFELSSINGIVLSVIGNESSQLRLGFNGRYLGEVNYNELPKYLEKMDIGILPFLNKIDNKGRFPMKLYEYAAAGLVVISYPFPGILSEFSKNHVGIQFAKGYAQEDYIECLNKVRDLMLSGKATEISLALRSLAEKNSWSRRANDYLTIIKDLLK
jgi:glycosyltransferase involved in cell wall biosynthesis